jgi:hypothetical protein
LLGRHSYCLSYSARIGLKHPREKMPWCCHQFSVLTIALYILNYLFNFSCITLKRSVTVVWQKEVALSSGARSEFRLCDLRQGPGPLCISDVLIYDEDNNRNNLKETCCV